MARHLVGLQAQENLPPYLSLAARLTSFDPYDVTAGLEDRSLVRFLTMRGTVHLLVADDALVLRQWTAPVHEREIKISQSIGAGARRRPGRVPRRRSPRCSPTGRSRRRRSASRWPSASRTCPPTQLGQLARSAAPLVQCPPRGTWKGSGGVVYQYVDRWLGRPLVEPDVEEIVRRYLRAFGPATAADVTAWSGVTRLGAGASRRWTTSWSHEDEQGKVALRRPRRRARRRGRARAGPAARPVRQRLALPRRPRPGHRPRVAQVLDGHQRRHGQHALRRRHAGRAVAGRGRPGRGPLDAAAAHEGASSPSSTTRSPASRRCSPVKDGVHGRVPTTAAHRDRHHRLPRARRVLPGAARAPVPAGRRAARPTAARTTPTGWCSWTATAGASWPSSRSIGSSRPPGPSTTCPCSCTATSPCPTVTSSSATAPGPRRSARASCSTVRRTRTSRCTSWPTRPATRSASSWHLARQRPVRASRAARAADAGGRGAQHLGAEPDGARAGVGERRELVGRQPALGADDHDDRPAAGRRARRAARSPPRAAPAPAARRRRSATTSAVGRELGDLGEPRPAGLLGRLAGRGPPLAPATSRPARPSRPRPSGRRPTARSGPRRSR